MNIEITLLRAEKLACVLPLYVRPDLERIVALAKEQHAALQRQDVRIKELETALSTLGYTEVK